jgi:hypothetical protein
LHDPYAAFDAMEDRIAAMSAEAGRVLAQDCLR